MRKIDVLVVVILIAGIASAVSRSTATNVVTITCPQATPQAIPKPRIQSNQFRLGKLAIGMSDDEVYSVRGTPRSKSTHDGLESWDWTNEREHSYLQAMFLDGELISIQSNGPDRFCKAHQTLPGLGKPTSDIIAALGKPDQQTATCLRYDNLPGRLTLQLRDDKVDTITLTGTLAKTDPPQDGNR